MSNSNDSSGCNFHVVALKGDPEQVADALIASELPKTFFDDVDLSRSAGIGQLLALFVTRMHKASIEKDEVIRFTERNRDQLPTFLDKILPAMIEIAKNKQEGKNLAMFMNYFTEQVHCAYSREYHKINIKSDRLLWLVYALASQLGSRMLTYERALTYLEKPEHNQRISPLSLEFMIRDYADLLNQSNRPSLEYVMLIGEAARMINDGRIAATALKIVLALGPGENFDHLLLYLNRAESYLREERLLDGEAGIAIQRYRQRLEIGLSLDEF